MKWFHNMRIKFKIILSFFIVALLLAGIGIYSLISLQQVNTNLEHMYVEDLSTVRDLSQAQIYYQRLRVNIRDVNLAQSQESKKNNVTEAEEIEANAEKLFELYNARTDLTSEESNLIKSLMSVWPEYKGMIDQAVQLAMEDKDVELRNFMKDGSRMNIVGDQIESDLRALIGISVSDAEAKSVEARSSFEISRGILIGCIILAFILSILLGSFVSSRISLPLSQVVELLKKVANGDLRETATIQSKDEVGQLAVSVNVMVDNLRNLINETLTSAQNLAAASQQISSSTEEIASGSNDQANAASNMNELFKELNTAINSVAASAEEASAISNNTLTIARDGGQVVVSSISGMDEVNAQMHRLEEDAVKIGDIIEVIDDIAEQTNLLALNAAIEAARAGEQGRGFAVVADEVRKLAERSGEATKQITDIIKGMQNNTSVSVKSAAEAVLKTKQLGEAFERIIHMVNESAQKVSEIAAATEEQAAQSTEVLQSIEMIASASEEAAAASEETASTSQSLARLAEDLNTTVSVFKTT